MIGVNTPQNIQNLLGKTDMYLIDLLQKGYFNSPLNILDAGCGAGRNLWMLAQLGHTITGLDQDPERINRLNEEIISNDLSHRISVGVGEMGNLPFKERVFDFVICNAVLHFAKDVEQFSSWLTNMVSVVKPGGIIFLRFVSSHTMEESNTYNQVLELADGSTRFVVDHLWLKEVLIPRLKVTLAEEFKTVNVADKRTMTTLVLRAK